MQKTGLGEINAKSPRSRLLDHAISQRAWLAESSHFAMNDYQHDVFVSREGKERSAPYSLCWIASGTRTRSRGDTCTCQLGGTLAGK